jgi:hypothetical protein
MRTLSKTSKCFIILLVLVFSSCFSRSEREINPNGILYPSYLLTGADLSLSVSGDSSALLGQSVEIDFTINNVSATDTGYFPTFRFVLPPELTYSSASCDGLGTPTVTVDNATPGVDPYTSESIVLAAGEDLVTVKPNVGQITPDQPNIECTLTFTVSGQTLNVADQIRDIRALFVLGEQFNGTPGDCGGVDDTLCSTAQTFDVTPTLLKLTRDSDQSDPHATGITRPITYSIAGDLAASSSLTNVVITEVLPDTLVLTPLADCTSFAISPAADTCLFTPDATAATGGTLQLTYATLSADLSISYDAYIREIGDGGALVVNATTGNATSNLSTVTLTSTEIPGGATANTTTNNRSVDVNKSASNTQDLGSVGNTPGDELTWTISTAISDYFKIDNITFADTMGDGLSYDNGTLSVSVIENGATVSCLEANLLAGGHLSITANPSGTTSIALNLTSAMADAVNCPGFADTEIWGASFHGSGSSSRVTLSYKSTILDNFTTVPPSGDVSVDSSEDLTNTLNSLEYDLVGGDSNETLNDSSTVTIKEITVFTKDFSHKNGIVTVGQQSVAAADTVTYKLTAVIPSGDAEALTITDYLPRPLFSSGTCPTHDALDTVPPVNGEWSFGTNTTGVAAGAVTITCNPTNNSIEFAFPDFDNAGGANATVEIYFTTTALPQPIADGLLQTNLAQLEYNDSNNTAAATAVGTINFVGDAPSLTTTKIATATDDAGATIASGNVTNIDADGLIDFKVTILNTGSEKAFDVELTDTLPIGLEAPTNPSSCSDATCGYNISTTGACEIDAVVPDTSASDETKVSVTNMRIDAAGSCEVTFQLRVKTDAEYASVITNQAVVLFASQAGGTDFSPSRDSSTVTIASPSVSKSASAASGTPADTVTFTILVTVPEGQGSNFRVIDVETTNFWGSPTAVAVTGGIAGAGPYCSVTQPDICFDNDPTNAANWDTSSATNFTINLGKMSNGATDDSDRTISFEITAPVLSISSGAKTNRGRVRWDNPTTTTVTSSNLTYTVLNPALAVSKCADTATTTAAPLSLAESAGFRILVRNTGSNLSKAYDIANVTDNLVQGLQYAPNTVNAYYCSSGAAAATCSGWTVGSCTGTLTNVTAAVRAGESVEASPFGGDSRQALSFPVVDDTGNPDMATSAYFVLELTNALSCDGVGDSDGVNNPIGSHPDNDGLANGCTDPVFVYASTLNNTGAIASYTNQDGVVGGETTYAAVNGTSATVTTDLDGDEILDSLETNADADGDGVPNYLDTDSDDNGILDVTEGIADADGDGTPNYKDTDDDNDGFTDATEIDGNGGAPLDTDGDGLEDYRDADSDGDGVLDASEGVENQDDDGDTIPNYQDFDSDNDGIPDLIEFGFGSYDTNGDGKVTAAELNAGSPDLDVNNDGAVSAAEFPGGVLPDADSDGTPNYLDLDSDNDGISDTDESNLTGFTGADNLITLAEGAGIDDGDAIAPPASDTSDVTGGAFDNNSILNLDEIPDSDGDDIPNYLDSDSDNDGVPDILENRRYVCDSNSNNQIDYPGEILACVTATDSDVDGYIQIDEFAAFDHDSDLTPDYLDLDSDNDSIADQVEAYSADIDTGNNDSISPAEYTAATGGGSGVGNQDGQLDIVELVDSDADTTPDIWDLDSDADNIYDIDEGDATPGTIQYQRSGLYNTDGTGAPDFRDTDADGDGVLDILEAGDASLLTTPVDTDGDLTPDFQDLDSDADGLSDLNETTLSTGRTTPDSDGDGALDGCEVFGNTAGCVYDDVANAGWYPGVGSVVSPITDPNDADTDDGGTNDFDEASIDNTNPRVGNGADDAFHSEDPDNDGLTNDDETVTLTICSTDPNDADSDDDGVPDGCEVLGTTTTPIDCSYDEAVNSSWFVLGALLTPLSNPCVVDTDGDGCDDFLETKVVGGMGTNPNDSDTDDDAVQDCTERNIGSDPNDTDTDNDGLPDGEEVNTIGSDPTDKDTDNDGCEDAIEVNTYETDPLADPDTDDDGLTDCEEKGTYNTNPNKKDTDGGGINDGQEVELKTDPLDPKDDCPNTRDTDDDGLTDCEEIDLGSDPFVSDGSIQGSGTSGLFGIGCSSNQASSLLLYLIAAFAALHFWKRKNEA